MSEAGFVFRDPPSVPGKNAAVQHFIEALRERPGQWAVYRTGLKQNPAHVQASMYRKKYPHVSFLARKDQDGTYAIFGKIEA